MLLPVLSLYVSKLEYATPSRIGLALGVYAFTQAIFQIPMGRLSDRFGRKPIIAGGLLIFITGSVVAAATQNIFFVIAGRALQGSGAISSAALALAADLSRDTQRTKFMALIGISIGLAFSAAFVLGPVIDGQLGLSGLFIVIAGLGLAAILILFLLVPNASPTPHPDDSEETDDSAQEAKSKSLNVDIFGGFFLHAILAMSFVAIPLHLATELAMPSSTHYRIYLPVILASLLVVGPLVMFSNRSGRQKTFILATIGALIIGLSLFNALPVSHGATYLSLVIFFIGFNYLEAALPSQISRESHSRKRGQTMGSYATLQFLGTFIGALVGGVMLERYGNQQVLLAAAAMACAWLLLSVVVKKKGSRLA